MAVRVEPVRDRRAFRAFQRLPWRIYRDLPLWVPPLLSDEAKQFRRDRNPFFAHGEIEPYLALRDGEVVGRIVAIDNDAHPEEDGQRLGFFGFLETVDDPEVIAALFAAAARWLREKKCTQLLGPANFTTNDTCGILVDGFDEPPGILMPYNPDYYVRLFDGLGLEKAMGLLAYYVDDTMVLTEQMRRIAARAERKGAVIREMDWGDLEREMEKARQIYNAAWVENWGYAPMTREEFAHTARDLKKIADRRFVMLAELDGRPVGFAASLPDYTPALRALDGRLTPWGLLRAWWAMRKVVHIRTMVLGVVPEVRRRGIDALMLREVIDRGLAAGYVSSELSWILENNELMNRALLGIGGVVKKRYALYRAPIEGFLQAS